MRENKYRAWDKRNNRWATLNLDVWGEWQGAKMVQIPAQRNPFDVFEMRSDEQYEWIQYTGLHDKNGKEIWEGDVVKINDARAGCVYYEEMYARFGFSLKRFLSGLVDLPSGDYSFEDFSSWDMEVIGNIYENPELLN